METVSGCFPAVWELDFENNGAPRSPVMDGSSNEVMLCIADQSSGSPDRIYVTVEEQPLQKMLSVWSDGPRLFVIVIDGLPVIKLTCWQTLICFISWMSCIEVFFFPPVLLALVNKGKCGGILHASFSIRLWSIFSRSVRSKLFKSHFNWSHRHYMQHLRHLEVRYITLKNVTGKNLPVNSNHICFLDCYIWTPHSDIFTCNLSLYAKSQLKSCYTICIVKWEEHHTREKQKQ